MSSTTLNKMIYIQEAGREGNIRQRFQVSSDMAWQTFCRRIQNQLGMENLEGLYSEEGVQYWRLETIPRGSVVFARASEGARLLQSLLTDAETINDVEQHLNASPSFLEQVRLARLHLKQETSWQEVDQLTGQTESKQEKEKKKVVKQGKGVPTSSSSITHFPRTGTEIHPLTSQANMHQSSNSNSSNSSSNCNSDSNSNSNSTGFLFESPRFATVDAILTRLNQERDNVELLLGGMRVLREKCTANAEDSARLVQQHGFDLLFHVLEKHAREARVIHACCCLIGSLLPQVSGCNAPLEKKILKCTIDLWREQKNVSIVRHGLIVYATALGIPGSIAATHHEEFDLLKHLFGLMARFPDEEDLYWYAISIIKAVFVDANVDASLNPVAHLAKDMCEELIRNMQTAKTRFYLNEKLQRLADFVLQKILLHCNLTCCDLLTPQRQGRAIGSMY